MSWTAAVFESMSGKQARYHRVTVRTMLDTLAARYGSNVQVGRAIGVSEAAIRRWRKGASPRNREALVHAYRVITMDPGRERQLRAGDYTLVLHQNAGGSDSERTRPIKVGSGLRVSPAVASQAVDAYLDGDDVGAARILHTGITDGYYSQWIVPDYDDDLADFGIDDDYVIN